MPWSPSGERPHSRRSDQLSLTCHEPWTHRRGNAPCDSRSLGSVHTIAVVAGLPGPVRSTPDTQARERTMPWSPPGERPHSRRSDQLSLTCHEPWTHRRGNAPCDGRSLGSVHTIAVVAGLPGPVRSTPDTQARERTMPWSPPGERPHSRRSDQLSLTCHEPWTHRRGNAPCDSRSLGSVHTIAVVAGLPGPVRSTPDTQARERTMPWSPPGERPHSRRSSRLALPCTPGSGHIGE